MRNILIKKLGRDIMNKISIIAIVLVTHDISVVSTYIDKIACVNRRLYYHGSKREGMRSISELYECPVQLITHDAAHSATRKK